jgi:hypothetical protein
MQRDATAGSQTVRKSIVNASKPVLHVHLTVIAANAKMMNNPDKSQSVQMSFLL